MPSKLPVRSWIKESVLFCLSVSILVMLASFMEEADLPMVLYKFFTSFFAAFLIILLNLYIQICTNNGDSLDFSIRTNTIRLAGSVLILYVLGKISEQLVVCGILDTHRPLIEGPKLLLYLLLQALIINFVIFLWLFFLLTKHTKMQHELERSRFAKAKSDAANQLLRQQIHPHFLFNALSTLKALIRKDVVTAEEYLIKLSDFLRVSVSSDPNGVTDLKQEIKLSKDYLEMQKMRFGDALRYDIRLPEYLLEEGRPVLPLFSLQSLVENAIKHNQLTKEFPLLVEIYEEDHWMVVRNNRQEKKIPEESTGSGLHNLVERYKMLMKNGIEIESTEGEFLVKLKILDYEDSVD